MHSDGSITRRAFLAASVAVGGCYAAVADGAPVAAPGGKRHGAYGSYCGLYCGACANLIKSEGAKSSKDVKCLGCKSGKAADWCAKCEIKACAKKHKVEYCGLCPSYPCDKLKPFHDNGKAYRLLGRKNCEAIRADGAEKWLAERKKRWSCGACGARLSWNDTKCPRCGKDILSAEEEATEYRKQSAQ